MSLLDDPELLATFVAEAEERLTSLRRGLLALDPDLRPNRPGPGRTAVIQLFRDAHTLKGSARMLGLEAVEKLAHAGEDLLGALRDGRMALGPVVIDVLLDACEAMRRTLPGAAGLDGDELGRMVQDLTAVREGRPRIPVPAADGTTDRDGVDASRARAVPPPRTAPLEQEHEREPEPPEPEPEPGPPKPQSAQAVAPAAVPPQAVSLPVDAARLHGLLDAVGETEVEARRLERLARDLARDLSRALAPQVPSAGEPTVDLAAAVAAVRELAEDHAARVSQLRAAALTLAMVPMSRATAGYADLVRLVARRAGRADAVRLVVEGEDVELDRRVLDGVSEALGHLLTNAVDHGTEAAEVRAARGKPEQLTVRLAARAAGGTVTVVVEDDGAGIDLGRLRDAAVRSGHLPADADPPPAALLPMVFRPAVSTRDAVSETSGRGVGLDAVREAVERLGGRITVASEQGAGTTFTVVLPVALGVLHCLLCRAGGERWAVPLAAVAETMLVRPQDLGQVAGATVLVRDGVPLPVVDLATALGAGGEAPRPGRERSVGLLTSGGAGQVVWLVDAVEGEDELVVTDLGPYVRSLSTGAAATGTAPVVSGASILGDGRAVCVLDLTALAGRERALPLPALRPTRAAGPAARPRRAARILVVEDSVGVREMERSLLARAGYEVDTARDGAEGADRLGGPPYDLVVTDLDMPGMDGLSLTRRLRATPGWATVPVVVVTSRDDESDRRAGLEAGADAYLLKSAFAPADLLGTVSRLLGGPHR